MKRVAIFLILVFLVGCSTSNGGTAQATSSTAAPASSSSVTTTAQSVSAGTTISSVTTAARSGAETTETTVADEHVKADDHPCLHVGNHEYEVCTAYVLNASGRRAAYYKFGHSDNQAMVAFWLHELETRYTGEARALIESQVADWPVGTMKVDIPHISIKSVDASLAADTATMQTVESWKVRTNSGQVLFEESDQPHTVTLSRVPGIFLHKWVVTSIN